LTLTTTTAAPGAARTDGESTAQALGRLRTLAETHGYAGDWGAVGDLLTTIEAAVVLGDRRTVRHQRERDEVARIVRAAFPGHDDGLMLVAEFRPRVVQRRYLRVPRCWPLIGERVQVTTVWAPDNSRHCLWSRTRRRNGPLTGPQLRRLDRLVRRLERGGVFHLALTYAAPVRTGFDWMEQEPDAYPGLERLELTVTPRRAQPMPDRPAPTRPVGVLHTIADAYQREPSAAQALERIGLELRLAGWNLARRAPEAADALPADPGTVLDVLHGIAAALAPRGNECDWIILDQIEDELRRLGWSVGADEQDEEDPEEVEARRDAELGEQDEDDEQDEDEDECPF
jgi:hypothetical protein